MTLSTGAQDAASGGRAAQRRRTRRAIVDATTRLLETTTAPTVDAIAAEAEVSRRTVYLYFPTLEQLHLEAMQGALLNRDVEGALDAAAVSGDVRDQVDALIDELIAMSDELMPLGRRIIRLTAEAPNADEPAEGAPRRGYRSIGWIEHAVAPLRERLTGEQFERLVSGLAMVISWEGMIVLRDSRGLRGEDERRLLRWAARSLVDAILAEAKS
ncbi:MAG TPA: helix-turn-helix domain-containing protein [Jatrophihabitantaceae bacterium]|nr:helix-turn-helix domain-containing protein [Jatrophihabitantaceae bacterium]